MNHFLKAAYDAGARQAMADMGLVKEAFIPHALIGAGLGAAAGGEGNRLAGGLAGGLAGTAGGVVAGRGLMRATKGGRKMLQGQIPLPEELVGLAGAGYGSLGAAGLAGHLGGRAMRDDPSWQDKLRGLVGR
jgi:hypothetical protein